MRRKGALHPERLLLPAMSRARTRNPRVVSNDREGEQGSVSACRLVLSLRGAERRGNLWSARALVSFVIARSEATKQSPERFVPSARPPEIAASGVARLPRNDMVGWIAASGCFGSPPCSVIARSGATWQSLECFVPRPVLSLRGAKRRGNLWSALGPRPPARDCRVTVLWAVPCNGGEGEQGSRCVFSSDQVRWLWYPVSLRGRRGA